MNIRLASRRHASFAFVIALFALTATSSFAQSVDPSAAPSSDPGTEFIIIVGG